MKGGWTWQKIPRLVLAIFLGGFFIGGLEAEEKEIKYKSQDLEKVRSELTTKKEEKERLEKESAGLAKEVKEGEARISNMEKTLIHTKNRTFQVSQELAEVKTERDQALEKLDENGNSIHRTARRYQIASIAGSPVGPQPIYLKQVLDRKVQDRKALQKKTSESTESLNELIDTQQALRGEVGRQESRLNNLKTGTENKGRQLTKKRSRQEILDAEVAELRRTAQELESLIDVLRSKSQDEKVSEKKARAQKQMSGHSPILAHSLSWPVNGQVKVRFGRQENPSPGTPLISNGIHIETRESQPVLAVANGKVLYAGTFMSYGTMVVLEHAGDWFSVYGQLAKGVVEKGQEIKKGEAVGQSSASGNSRTYFELRFYGKPTDPLPWLAH